MQISVIKNNVSAVDFGFCFVIEISISDNVEKSRNIPRNGELLLCNSATQHHSFFKFHDSPGFWIGEWGSCRVFGSAGVGGWYLKGLALAVVGTGGRLDYEIATLPVTPELDAGLTADELSKVSHLPSSGKAFGKDAIPAEICKRERQPVTVVTNPPL